MWQNPPADVRLACRVMFGARGLVRSGLPWGGCQVSAKAPLPAALHRLPKVGRYVEQLNRAIRMYYSHPWVLPWTMILGLVVQSLFAVALGCLLEAC